MRESATVDLERIDFIAVVEIDDADHDPPTRDRLRRRPTRPAVAVD